MPVKTETIQLQTKGEVGVLDITGDVDAAVRRAGLKEGIACVFVPGATGAVTTIEYENGLVSDLTAALERLFPKGLKYGHNTKWGDENGHSHIRASFIGPSLTVPLSGGRMVLGRWQQIVFLELDNRPRERKVIVQIVGE